MTALDMSEKIVLKVANVPEEVGTSIGKLKMLIKEIAAAAQLGSVTRSQARIQVLRSKPRVIQTFTRSSTAKTRTKSI